MTSHRYLILISDGKRTTCSKNRPMFDEFALAKQKLLEELRRVLGSFVNIPSAVTSRTTRSTSRRTPSRKKGVRQGDTISPKLFTTALNHAMLQLDWDDKGINIDGKKLSNLRFADDIFLISQRQEELQQMVKELNEVGKVIGLTMNRTKTMVMRNEWAHPSPIVLEGSALPDTDCYVYLGRVISMDNNLRAEIMRRKKCAWQYD
ncbi:hypothetical protein TELCIR_12396 [Teladorsagia circumcincta]|uniref:Reverse transcriptase domain-containing protein n=1 Tax=Teladorsagia circumcincta TaxID=45464 RepID=A0A2G9U6K9_TELCI|nr:hypothetical protein TELCIR_12396 [Teladorsagia circumcincta]